MIRLQIPALDAPNLSLPSFHPPHLLSLKNLCFCLILWSLFIMSSTAADMEPLTSGASNRIIPVLKTVRTSLLFIHSLLFSLFLLLLPRRYRSRTMVDSTSPPSPSKLGKRRRLEEEDTLKRRALAEGIDMTTGNEDCRWNTFLFFGSRRNALFVRSWLPITGQMK